METEPLFFKDKITQGNNVEIIFHKDFTYNYNAETFPVVKYTLFNCTDLDSKDFGQIDYYNDGVYVDTRKEDSHSIFEVTDMVFERLENIAYNVDGFVQVGYLKNQCFTLPLPLIIVFIV